MSVGGSAVVMASLMTEANLVLAACLVLLFFFCAAGVVVCVKVEAVARGRIEAVVTCMDAGAAAGE